VLNHIVMRLQHVLNDGTCANPWNGACWRDEGNIGKVMKVVASVDSRKMSIRALQYLSAGLNLRIARMQ